MHILTNLYHVPLGFFLKPKKFKRKGEKSRTLQRNLGEKMLQAPDHFESLLRAGQKIFELLNYVPVGDTCTLVLCCVEFHSNHASAPCNDMQSCTSHRLHVPDRNVVYSCWASLNPFTWVLTTIYSDAKNTLGKKNFLFSSYLEGTIFFKKFSFKGKTMKHF